MLAGGPILPRRSMFDAGAGPPGQPAHCQPQQRGDLPPPLLGRHCGLGMLDGHGRPPVRVRRRPHREGRSPFT
jgi:hypothetical protein